MTIAFDHRVPGTLPSAWDVALAGTVGIEPPGRGARVVVLSAHPDDESLGAGGLIAASVAAGADVQLLVATDGRFSHPDSPTHTPEQLAALRRDEMAAGSRALGIANPPIMLGLCDGSLELQAERLAHALAPHLRDATHVLTTWEHDGHADHEVCARVVRRLLAGRRDVVHWQYPIWLWHWGDPSSPDVPLSLLRVASLDADALRRKAAALECHRSQYLPLSPAPGDEPILPMHVLAHFERDVEYLVVNAPASDPSYFEALYAAADDPWGLADRFYERRKRAAVLAALPRERFHRVFEPGCAIGLLTEQLAERADEILAWDVVAAAARRTAHRLRATGNGRVEARGIPGDWPPGSFDLIVLSEVGYYCPDLTLLKERIDASLAPDGLLLGCHWRHPAPDHPQTAEAVHLAIGAGLQSVVSHVEEDFLLDVWSRSRLSVARETGIVP
jgi:LmbE family N-acetylglucosaminyl deacetylase/SAM-dependent methyltransferase